MTTTITGSGVTFNSGNSQTEAVGTNFGDVGSYIIAYTATTTPSSITRGSTDSGSNLRHESASAGLGIKNTGYSTFYLQAAFAGALSLSSFGSLSGTWRVMSGISASNTSPQLWVRVS